MEKSSHGAGRLAKLRRMLSALDDRDLDRIEKGMEKRASTKKVKPLREPQE